MGPTATTAALRPGSRATGAPRPARAARALRLALGLSLWLAFTSVQPAWGMTFLDVEGMVKAKVPDELIRASLEAEKPRFQFEQVVYLKDRGLSPAMVSHLLRYYLQAPPPIDVDFLVRLKALALDDETIEMLVNRGGHSGGLESRDVIRLKAAGLNDKLVERLIRTP